MLRIHRAERADALVDALGDLVGGALDDPMAAEVVAVPTRGVERWLAQRLAGRLGVLPGRSDGVCANVDFPFPGRLVGGAVAAAAGIDRDTDPWLPERSVWPLLEVVDENLGEPWLASLTAHLGATTSLDDDRRARRFSTVRHLADLFDRYGVHRPEMLRVWAGGADTDGTGRPLPGDAAWQAELWRRLRRRVARPSPAERLAGACDRLRADASLVDLPPRVSLFGLTSLPASHIQVLRALAIGRDVHLFLLHPSPALWGRVEDATRGQMSVPRRVEDVTATLPRHPLLSSWAQDAREMQLVLTAGGGASADDHRAVETVRSTLLHRIQADIRADRRPPGVPLPGHEEEDERWALGPDDRSLQVHACHGLARQVEVLRDAVLHLLAADASLEARDVIVMCPDIETFAPLIHATFGAGDADQDEDAPPGAVRPPDLRVRLADRSLRRTNPVLGVVAEVLELASSRLTAAEVLDLAGREPVRRRFGFDDDDLARVEDWAAATGVRWGLDAAQRDEFQLGWLDANTWRAGLDRLLLGVAVAEEGHRLVGGILPLDDVGSGDIDLAGRLAELIDRLHDVVGALSRPQPVSSWAAAVSGAADALTATTEHDLWQRAQLQAILDDVVTEATIDGRVSVAPLALAEIRDLLADRLRGRPTRANFRTGHLTICTLVPMRSVPHRVVCLLGLDDGVFPRRTTRDGDDIILNDPHVGDRDARTEDRQLLLDALLAATDNLVVTYAGRDERTNAERPPAVPLGELLEVVDRTARTGEETAAGAPVPARDRVVVRHPLQPFDVRNFTVGTLVGDRPWSFDPVALDGARALSSRRRDPVPFLSEPLPPAGDDPVEVEQLVRFVQHPVRAFLRQRLGMSLSDRHEELGDAVPIELDYLEQWAVGQRLLDARLAGADAQACIEAELARGILPPGALADPILRKVGPMVDEVAKEALRLAAGPASPALTGRSGPASPALTGRSGPASPALTGRSGPASPALTGRSGPASPALTGRSGPAESGSAEVNLRLPGGPALVGTVPGVAGNRLSAVAYSRLGAKHRLAAWVRFLVLAAAYPDRSVEAVTIGRRRAGGPPRCRVTVSRLAPLAGDPAKCRELALGHLGVLVDLYQRGLREPLPLYCDTSAAYAEAVAAGRDAMAAAAKAWDSDYEYDREDKGLEHLLVLGGRRPFAEVHREPAGAGEAGEGWAADEPSRFGRCALRLWGGLLSHECLEDR